MWIVWYMNYREAAFICRLYRKRRNADEFCRKHGIPEDAIFGPVGIEDDNEP